MISHARVAREDRPRSDANLHLSELESKQEFFPKKGEQKERLFFPFLWRLKVKCNNEVETGEERGLFPCQPAALHAPCSHLARISREGKNMKGSCEERERALKRDAGR